MTDALSQMRSNIQTLTTEVHETLKNHSPDKWSMVVWLYAMRLEKTPARCYATQKITQFAFADIRRTIAHEFGDVDFDIGCPKPVKPAKNSFMCLVA